MTLFARLLLLVGMALLPALAVQMHFRSEAVALRDGAVREEAERLLRANAAVLQSVADGARQFLVAMRDRRSVIEGASERCDAAFARMMRELPQYVAISATDARGIITCAADPRAQGIDVSDVPWFAHARDEGGFVLGDYWVGRASGQPSLHFGYAIEDQDGRFAGALVVGVGLDWLARQLAATPLPAGAVLMVADRNGTLLVDQPGQNGTGRRLPAELMATLQGDQARFAEHVGPDSVLRAWAVSPLGLMPRDLFVAVGLDKTRWSAPLRAADRQGALLIVAGAVIALGFALVVGQRAVEQPVACLLEIAERWRHGDLTARAAATPVLARQGASSEFGRLAAAFDAVAASADSREQALRASEGRFRALAEAVPEMLVSMRADGGWDYGSPRFSEYTGLSAEDAMGHGWMRALRPDDLDALRATVMPAILAGEPWEATCRLRRQDGAWRWFMLRAVPIRDEAGRVQRWFGAVTDIDDRKRDEAALRESEARFRQIADAVEDVIWLAEPARNRTIYLSPAFARVFGRTPPPLPAQGSAWDDAVHPEDRARVAAARASAPVEGFDIEYRILRPDGSLRWLRDRCFPVQEHDGAVRRVAGVASDVTERRAARERQALLAAEVDHRAKNVLAVVQSLVRLTPAEDPAQFARAVEGRITALARAHGLLARGSWSGASLEATLRAELAPHARAGRVTSAGPAVTLMPEAVQPLAMVLHELATNAAKYGALSRAEGRLSVAWRIRPDGVLSIDWVERGGPGVTPARHAGFGTTLIEANMHGPLRGAVRYDWRDEGLAVELTVAPALLREGGLPHPDGSGAEGPADALQCLSGRRVLLAEDEVLLALETSATLAAMGCEVIGPAGTVRQALRLTGMMGGGLDAAVLDANLAGEEVAPVAEALRAKGVPIVFVTGYAGLVRPWTTGAPVIEKPLVRGALQTALTDVLGLQAAK